MEMACVDCAVKTESLKIIQDNFRHERVNVYVGLYTQIVNIFIFSTTLEAYTWRFILRINYYVK